MFVEQALSMTSLDCGLNGYEVWQKRLALHSRLLLHPGQKPRRSRPRAAVAKPSQHLHQLRVVLALSIVVVNGVMVLRA